MRSNQDKFMLRLPDGWRAALKAKAALNRRSLNQEILIALEGVVMVAAGADLGGHAPAAVKAQQMNQHEASTHADD